MSGPLNNLKKNRKSPLLTGSFATASRNVPYRNPTYTNEESALLDQITSKMATSKIAQARSSMDSISPAPGKSPKSGPSDNELMGLMMKRLGGLESKVASQAKEIQEKDKKIKILEEKLALLQKSREPERSGMIAELERKCWSLQQQTQDMEDFLADYGMVWVGEDELPELPGDSASDPTAANNAVYLQGDMWRPETSVADVAPFDVDYDLVLQNIEELNGLAGEGVGQVERTADGARIKMPETIPLTLYSNGIVMFAGPFRSFEDAETQECLQDIMDGYFPSELQTRFPDGVPFHVIDKRNVFFKDKTSTIFAGSGQLLGGETKPSRLVPSGLSNNDGKGDKAPQKPKRVEKATETADVETALPGSKVTVDQFLNRLPQNVIKHGKVIDIRSSVGQALHGSSGQASTVTVVDTEAMQEMKQRLGVAESERPPTGRYTTLRVKDETGDNTYILKMRYNDTVLSVRQQLTKHRSPAAPPYALISTFPHRTYDDLYATLADCGLTPNATLYLKPTRGAGREGQP